MQQTSWINQLGSWNPQLLREWRGRLKTRNVLAAIALSVIGQILLLLINEQPVWREESFQEYWEQIWNMLTWSLPYLLFVLGSYYIVADITQEEKRGTLNFIRLSPRPGWQILLGKLLGVPILPCLMIATLLPLHLWSALCAGISPLFMLSYYLILGGTVFLCYSAALLYGLTGSSQKALLGQQGTTSISFGAIALFFISPLFMVWNTAVTWQGLGNTGTLVIGASSMQWVYLPIATNPFLAHFFTLANIAIVLALIWRMLLRRFRQPRSTLMSKRQSYALLAYIEILMVGFTLVPEANRWDSVGLLVFMTFISTLLIFLMMFAIVPQRQALIDWSRYQKPGLQSWIWADKSPILLTVVIQICMVCGLLGPWMFLAGIGRRYPLATIVTVVGLATTLFIYGVFIQTIMAGRTRNPFIWTTGSLLVWLIVPPVILLGLRITPERMPSSAALWTFFGYPFFSIEEPQTFLFTVVGIVFQWMLLGLLLWPCNATLNHLRASR